MTPTEAGNALADLLVDGEGRRMLHSLLEKALAGAPYRPDLDVQNNANLVSFLCAALEPTLRSGLIAAAESFEP